MTTPIHCWIDVEDSAGVRQGSGPLHNIVNWQSTARLSKAGEFSFTVPAHDPQVALLVARRIVRCFAILEGMPQEIGAGIIDRIQYDGDMVAVSGPDLLAELRYRSVHGLKLYDETQHTAHAVVYYAGGSYGNLPDCHDGDFDSADAFTLSATNEFLFIGYTAPFNVLYFWQADAMSPPNSSAARLNYGYSTAAIDPLGIWPEFAAVQDTISTDGVPWAAATVDNDPLNDGSGTVLFPRNSAWAQATVNGISAYWIRIDPDAGMDTVTIDEVQVGIRTPTLSDVSGVMNLAPGAWTGWAGDADAVTIFDSTTDGTYAAFAGETVLAALTKIADRAGESFRLGPNRRLHWLHSLDGNFAAAGVRALRYTGSPRQDTNLLACYVTALEQVHDSAEYLTRIYPYGAGNASARVTLSNATLTMPTGYTLDPLNNFIKRDAADATAQIDAVLAFKDVHETEDFMGGSVEICNQLAQLALDYLKKHSQVNEFYRLEVTGMHELLQVGTKIHLIYRDVRDGVTAVNIDDYFIVTGVTHAFAAGQVFTAGLEIGTVAAWPQTDAEIVADYIEQGVIYEAHIQRVSGAAVDGAISTASAIVPGDIADLNESIDDRVAALIADSGTITWAYDDALNTLIASVIPSGVDHGGLVGLADDDHTQYALLAGRSGGQTLYGGTGSSDILRLYGYSGALTYLDVGPGGFTLDRDGGSATCLIRSFNTSGVNSTLTLGRARGTLGSPSDVGSGDLLGRVTFNGYVNGAWSGSRGLLNAYAAEAWSSSAQGTRWGLQSTEAGGTTALWNWSVDGSGNFRLFLAPTTAIGASAKYVLAFGAQATRPTTLIADQVSLWNENQQARAGDAGLHIWPEVAGSEYSFGKQFQCGGGLATAIVAKTDSYTATLADHTIVCNKATAMTITLPTAASAYNSTPLTGQEYYIKQIGAGAVTIDANGTETIDGALTQVLAQWQTMHIQSDGVTWWIL